MAGELWRATAQIGVETTYGTAVAASRKMYYEDPMFQRTRAPRPWKFATGTRDNVRNFTLGPQVVAAQSIKMPLSASEIIEALLTGINGTVTPTQPNAGSDPTCYLWTFTPGTSLKSATVEWQDGANPWHVSGCYTDTIEIAGSADQQNSFTTSVFGSDLVAGALTGSLADRTPDFIEGWETKMYIDAYAGTPGTTVKSGTLVNWNLKFTNNLGRKYFADNVNSLGAVTIGELGVDATLTFEASSASGLAEFANWDAVTERLVRLEFGQNTVISHAYKKFVTVDIPGAWSALDLGKTDAGTRVYEMKLQYVYDTTNLYGIQIRAQNTRSAAW